MLSWALLQPPRFKRGGFSPKTLVRMRGLEPPPGFPDTDLNRARLPIPPHPRAGGEPEDIARAADRPSGALPASRAGRVLPSEPRFAGLC
jgi:hypothetical protein